MEVLGIPITFCLFFPDRWELPKNSHGKLAPLDSPGSVIAGSGRNGEREKRNPAEVLLSALTDEHLAGAFVKSLPWTLAAVLNIDQGWLGSKLRCGTTKPSRFCRDSRTPSGEKADPATVDRTRAWSKTWKRRSA